MYALRPLTFPFDQPVPHYSDVAEHEPATCCGEALDPDSYVEQKTDYICRGVCCCRRCGKIYYWCD